MSPVAEAQDALEESKARSAISYSPEEIFQKSWQASPCYRERERDRKRENEFRSPSKLPHSRDPSTSTSLISLPPSKKKSFQTYQLVVDVGLLGHAKLASTIVSQLSALRRTRGRPLTVLDLGSGDAGCLTRALAAEAVKLSSDASSSSSASASSSAASDFIARYTCVDESEPALALAAKNVEANLPGTEGRFFVGDFLSAAERSGRESAAADAAAASSASASASASPPPPPEGGYDAIVASLSAHHLSTEKGKPALVSAARRALFGKSEEEEKEASSNSDSSSSSLLIIADVFLNDNDDSVDAWRRRSCAIIREQWPLRVPGGKLSSEEADRIASHVGTCDIPARVSDYSAFAKDAGFRKCEKAAEIEEELGIRVIVMEA